MFRTTSLILTLALLPLPAFANTGTSALFFRPTLGLVLLVPVIFLEHWYYKWAGVKDSLKKSASLNILSYLVGTGLSVILLVSNQYLLWFVPIGDGPGYVHTAPAAWASLIALVVSWLGNFALSVFIEGGWANYVRPEKYEGVTWKRVVIVHAISYAFLGIWISAAIFQYGRIIWESR